MNSTLYLLATSREPISPKKEDQPAFEELFKHGLAEYVYGNNPGYVISAKGRETANPHKQRDKL